jgi:hypothetical protein
MICLICITRLARRRTSACARPQHNPIQNKPCVHRVPYQVSDFGLCKTLHKVREDGSPYQMTGPYPPVQIAPPPPPPPPPT